jgi:hypothetical protein
MLPIHSSPMDEADPAAVPQPKILGISSSGIVGPHMSFADYFGRMLRYSQMDFDYTFAQMVYLCLSPSKVYQLTQYRKRTKGTWSRDDPCFIVVQAFFLAMAGWGYGICFGETWWAQLRSFAYFFFLHFAVLGLVVSGLCLLVADRYLRKKSASVHSASQPMEYLYAFDVHCNAFFPLFLLTYVVQFLALPLLYSEGLVGTVLANLLHVFAVAYYCYVVSLGYNTLPFIDRAEIFMAPAVVFAIAALFLTVFTRTNLTIVFVEWTTGVL